MNAGDLEATALMHAATCAGLLELKAAIRERLQDDQRFADILARALDNAYGHGFCSGCDYASRSVRESLK